VWFTATSNALIAQQLTAWPHWALPPCMKPWVALGLMKPYMRPIYPGAQVSGTAVTVLLHPGDNWMMHVVAEQIQSGDIVVAAISADNCDGFFGDLLATSFQARGARGLVIDAGVRDIKTLERDELPCLEQRREFKGHHQIDPWFGQHSGGVRWDDCQPG
jgi:regulator of RNase E activity RraA